VVTVGLVAGCYVKGLEMANSQRGGSSDWQRQQAALAKEAERQRRVEEQTRKAAEKEVQRQHLEARKRHVDTRNQQLAGRIAELESALRHGLSRPSAIHPDSFLRRANISPLDLGALATPIPVPNWAAFQPGQPGVVSRMFGGAARHEQRLAQARAAYDNAVRAQIAAETERQRRVTAARRDHAELVRQEEARIRSYNDKVVAWSRSFRDRQQGAVEDYYDRVLAAMPLPSGCPRKAEVAYSPQHEQVVIQFELPGRDVVPADGSYQFLSTKDEIRTVARKPKEIADCYRGLISQIALLCIRDLFRSDNAVQTVGFNGHVHATNPATGKREYPCIISLNAERSEFPSDAELHAVEPDKCVRHLKAIVSNHPYELEPIEPILDFDLSKYSFVQGLDAVATLDSRPDLLKMSATNFEHLVRQLFEAQGLQGWTTTQSNDDGVDAVIVNKTSIVGGLAIVQAKRYSIAVGISHVRELAGAIEEKKAGKGILVTTSWFTAKCYEKAREHGRMELIDGKRLIFLIKEHLHKDVLIGIAKWPRSQPSEAD
jgi:restriction system protein